MGCAESLNVTSALLCLEAAVVCLLLQRMSIAWHGACNAQFLHGMAHSSL